MHPWDTRKCEVRWCAHKASPVLPHELCEQHELGFRDWLRIAASKNGEPLTFLIVAQTYFRFVDHVSRLGDDEKTPVDLNRRRR